MEGGLDEMEEETNDVGEELPESYIDTSDEEHWEFVEPPEVFVPEEVTAYIASADSSDLLYTVDDNERDPEQFTAIFENLLGEYQPKTQIVAVYDANGSFQGYAEEYVSGLAGLDFVWIAACLSVLIVLGRLFTFAGQIFKRGGYY